MSWDILEIRKHAGLLEEAADGKMVITKTSEKDSAKTCMNDTECAKLKKHLEDHKWLEKYLSDNHLQQVRNVKK
ncbi:hypothetical protein M0R04_07320 [Candidatus Dojkabacteria bacterium]|jgi:hypothetical protein|nr:hypothetical protein [Candidatus Dojkabacteria bacterium]